MGGLGVTIPPCTQAQLLDPSFAYSDDGALSWNINNPAIMCDPNATGSSGTGAPSGASKSLIPGVSNGLLVGVCVALLIWIEFK